MYFKTPSIYLAVLLLCQSTNASVHCNTYITKEVQGSTQPLLMKVPAHSTSINCNLNTGDKNSGVSTLQSTLNLCYGKKLDVDGDYGPKTKAAVLDVQHHIGMVTGAPYDGEYGPLTRRAMQFWAGLNNPSMYGECLYLD